MLNMDVIADALIYLHPRSKRFWKSIEKKTLHLKDLSIKKEGLLGNARW